MGRKKTRVLAARPDLPALLEGTFKAPAPLFGVNPGYKL